MQVSTGLVWPADAIPSHVPLNDLVMVAGTAEQVASLSRAVQIGRRAESSKKARRVTQRASRRVNRR